MPPPPSPTDLSGVTQAWDKKLTTGRFTVLSAFGGAAVRDNETGLVWEQAPSTATASWFGARLTCADKAVGGRKGWRLPSLPELTSLIDPSVASPGPTLPAGHPFTNVQQSAAYWSATTSAEAPTGAWAVLFFDGLVRPGDQYLNGGQVWCVRGGMNADAY